MATYPLRPFSVGEILDNAVGVYRRIFGTLLAIAITCQGAPSIIQIYLQLSGGAITAPWLWLFSVLLTAIGGLIAAGATLWAISETYLGSEASLGGALNFAIGKAWRLFVAGLAKYLVGFLAALLFLIPGIIVACGYSVVAQAVVLEDDLRAPTDALGRSWFLTKGFKWRAFGLYVIVYVILYVPFVAGGVLAAVMPGVFENEAATLTLAIAAQVLWLALYPIFSCVFTLFYYDLRVRKEGFDLMNLARQLGIEPEAHEFGR